jgi:hypothetical protein
MTTRRMLHLPAALLGSLAAAVVLACAAALLAGSQKAEATFPGKNGRIAYSGGTETTAQSTRSTLAGVAGPR